MVVFQESAQAFLANDLDLGDGVLVGRTPLFAWPMPIRPVSIKPKRPPKEVLALRDDEDTK